MPTRVYLVRRGATDLTAEDRFAGSTDVSLSEDGRRQVMALAERLRCDPLDAVYASPMSRTLETARIIAKPHGLEPLAMAARAPSTGSAGFPAGSPPTRLDAGSAASGLRRIGVRARPFTGSSVAIRWRRRCRSRAGGIEPPVREAGWKAGGPSPRQLADRGDFVGIPQGQTTFPAMID